MLDELSKVRFARFRFHLKAQTPLYKGSTLRGGFGLNFKMSMRSLKPLPVLRRSSCQFWGAPGLYQR